MVYNSKTKKIFVIFIIITMLFSYIVPLTTYAGSIAADLANAMAESNSNLFGFSEQKAEEIINDIQNADKEHNTVTSSNVDGNTVINIKATNSKDVKNAFEAQTQALAPGYADSVVANSFSQIVVEIVDPNAGTNTEGNPPTSGSNGIDIDTEAKEMSVIFQNCGIELLQNSSLINQNNCKDVINNLINLGGSINCESGVIFINAVKKSDIETAFLNPSGDTSGVIASNIANNAYEEDGFILVTVQESSGSGKSVFDDNVTLEWSYNIEEGFMPYGLFTPSNADELESVPLIIWLHGNFDNNPFTDEGRLYSDGLPNVISSLLDKNGLQKFSAYVLCPHLTNAYSSEYSGSGVWYGTWYDPNALTKVKNVVDKFISEHNVDTENVVLVGHSMGGSGAIYIGYYMSDYFSKIAILSGSNLFSSINLSELKDKGIEIIAYVGEADTPDYRQGFRVLQKQLGEENCFEIATGHGTSTLAFTLDDGSCVRNRSVMEDQI